MPVPLDYRHPAGRRITIAISRIVARDPGLRRGILLVNQGGPGVPGLVDFPRVLEFVLPQAVLDRYDIIGFDPRGVEYSSPVSCGLTPQEGAEASPPLMQPGGFAATVAFERWVADRCAATSGALLPYVTTANTARDMDAIRATLGEAKLSYYGGSYGTYLGAVFGFNRSSQHLDERSCDERTAAKVRPGCSSADVLAGAAIGGGSRGAPAVLGRDRPRCIQRGRG